MKRRASSAPAFTLSEVICVLVIVFILVSLLDSLGLFDRVSVKGLQAYHLGQAHAIGLALQTFADDHNGVFPKIGNPAELTGVAGSNDAFACLFPAYLQDETWFANKRSADNYKAPDNRIDPSYTGTRTLTLANGENALAYMMNLTESGNRAWPLVVDAPSSASNPTYPSGGPAVRGSVWDGQNAIIVCVDDSASLAKVDKTTSTVKRTDMPNGGNILIPVAAKGTDPGWATGGILELPQ